MPILPRITWTTSRNGRESRPLDPKRVTGVAVHYPASGNVKLAGLSLLQVAAKLRGWRNYHLSRGWADIGYNFAIDGAGRIWNLTGYNVGAHANAVGNTTRVGVLFVLGNNEEPTTAQRRAFTKLRTTILKRLPRATRIEGHQQIPGNSTACPGGPLMARIKSGTLTLEKDKPMSISNKDLTAIAAAVWNHSHPEVGDVPVESASTRFRWIRNNTTNSNLLRLLRIDRERMSPAALVAQIEAAGLAQDVADLLAQRLAK